MSVRNTTLTTKTVTLSDEREIAYASSGDEDGYPVIAHHGTPGSRLFAGVLSEAATAAGVHLIVPDRPGYGQSSPPPRGWNWRDWPSDLTELRRAESIDRAALVGFSGGGPFAVAATTTDWATRLGLVSSVIPPLDTGLATLSKVPFALRGLFRLSKAFATVSGPSSVVGQYTDRSLSTQVSRAVADDFHEALRQDAKAVARENRSFATTSLEIDRLSVPVRAWHGTEDENTSLSPVRAFIDAADGSLVTDDTDHLGTLLDYDSDVFKWLSEGR